MYAKHSVFYDALPHYFLEFDILDRQTGLFLDTPSRRELTRQMPVVSVPVLKEGTFFAVPGDRRIRSDGRVVYQGGEGRMCNREA